jgi:hypothetical protein
MSLFTNPIRPAPIASDAAVRRYIEAIRRQIEPDPLYRRGLRGQVVNRFVAQKRGIDLTGTRRPARMGALGRACLYASFALAVSVTGVMAASDAAIPGDALYPLKLSIEEMRLDVLPEEFRDELAVYALSERIDELSQLVEAGDMARASTLARPIHDAYEQAMAASDDAGTLARRLHRQVAWLAEVVSGLPSQAQASIEEAMAGAPGLMLDAWTSDGSEPGAVPASSSGGAGQGRGTGQGEGSDPESGAAAPGGNPSPDATPEPERTPQPERSPRPEPTPGDDASSTPKPSPKGQANDHAPAP